MKYLWLLALPYVVISTNGVTRLSLNGPGNQQVRFECTESNCDWIYDLAEALNTAHERRAFDGKRTEVSECRFPCTTTQNDRRVHE